jgi:hypothetical protein
MIPTSRVSKKADVVRYLLLHEDQCKIEDRTKKFKV